MAGDVEAFHLGFAELDAVLIASRVECAFDFQTGGSVGCTDQFDHGEAIEEQATTPVLGDVAERPMLDLVPL